LRLLISSKILHRFGKLEIWNLQLSITDYDVIFRESCPKEIQMESEDCAWWSVRANRSYAFQN
jgi:hypothetical protein